jgi:glycosyltransferase involved in cell wall biosynthesis
MTMLFIGPLPEPMTGQALACRVILDSFPKEHRVDLINLSKKDFKAGVSSLSRISEVARILSRVWRKKKTADVIYLTVSESTAGIVKDLVIYLLCFDHLGYTVIHLLGGANMKRIMLGENRVLRQLNTFFIRRLGGVVVEGDTQADIYRAAVPAEKIHVVPNFAQDELFTTYHRIDQKFADTNPLRLLFLSNLLPGKGHDELVEAFLALDDTTRRAVRLDFAGGFESQSQRQTFLGRIAGQENISYHGPVRGQQRRDLFDQAHVFCLPTYYPYEGQPISIVEAYASGCAVITTDHSGIRDVFRDQVNGIEVSTRSIPDLKRAIKLAVAQPDFLRAVARSNLDTALARHKTDRYGRTIVNIIERAARTRNSAHAQ